MRARAPTAPISYDLGLHVVYRRKIIGGDHYANQNLGCSGPLLPAILCINFRNALMSQDESACCNRRTLRRASFRLQHSAKHASVLLLY